MAKRLLFRRLHCVETLRPEPLFPAVRVGSTFYNSLYAPMSPLLGMKGEFNPASGDDQPFDVALYRLRVVHHRRGAGSACGLSRAGGWFGFAPCGCSGFTAMPGSTTGGTTTESG